MAICRFIHFRGGYKFWIALMAIFTCCAGELCPAFAQPGEVTNQVDVRSVRDFGAVGDGKADDTSAIQRAIDSRMGELRFPRGTYRITETLRVPLRDVGPVAIVADGSARVVMDGTGPAIRFVGTHNGTASPDTVRDTVWAHERSPVVDGLEIVGRNPLASGIEADGTMQLTLSRVVVRKALHGIRLVNRNRNVIISDCHLYENRGVGILYDHVNLHQSNIVGSHISYNSGGGIVIRGGDVRNVHIGTCDIEGNMGDDGSKPTANILLDSTGGSTGEVAIVGCTIQHTHNAAGSANIRINGESTKRGFTEETRHGNIVIANNVLSDAQFNLDVANTRGIAITGNTIWKGYTNNLRIVHSESMVVSANVFDRNPRYHYGDGSKARLGLEFVDCHGCTFNANHIEQVGDVSAALLVRDCSHFNITDSTILDCSPCGIWLQDVAFSRVSDCLIHESNPPSVEAMSLRAIGGKSNMIVDNLLSKGYFIGADAAYAKGNQVANE